MPRVVIDTSVWFKGESCTEAILGFGNGLAEGYWSAQIVGELTRTRLWVGKVNLGRRSISEAEYLNYRERQYNLIAEIDRVCHITRPSDISPTQAELVWAEADPEDLAFGAPMGTTA